jgi:hypothetical protein
VTPNVLLFDRESRSPLCGSGQLLINYNLILLPICRPKLVLSKLPLRYGHRFLAPSGIFIVIDFQCIAEYLYAAFP